MIYNEDNNKDRTKTDDDTMSGRGMRRNADEDDVTI